MSSQKPGLLFIPHYLGSLKYFEKLVPYLIPEYEISFLFMPHLSPERISEMQTYCQKNNFQFIDFKKRSAPGFLKFIPFLNPLIFFLRFRNQAQNLFKKTRVKKIISVFDAGFYYYLLKKANKQNIETFVLQWALSTELDVLGLAKKKLSKEISKNQKKTFKEFYGKLASLFLQFLCYSFKSPSFVGNGSCQKFGVINQQAFQIFKKAGIKESKMTIVGHIDFTLAKNAQKQFSTQESLKNLAKKLEVDLDKTSIAIYSSMFNSKDVKIFSNREQLDYYENIIKIIRKVFPENESNILFKAHPAESPDFYASFKKYGVKIFGKETANEELILISSLYIAHYSTTNLIATILKKPCIFINLANTGLIESTKELFGIKEYIKTKEKFEQLLWDFKNGRLNPQYEYKEEIFTQNSIEKIIAWIK